MENENESGDGDKKTRGDQIRDNFQASRIRRMQQRKRKLEREVSELQNNFVYLTSAIDDSLITADAISRKCKPLLVAVRKLVPEMDLATWKKHKTILDDSLKALASLGDEIGH